MGGYSLKGELTKYTYLLDAEPAVQWVMAVAVRGSIGTYSWEASGQGVMGIEWYVQLRWWLDTHLSTVLSAGLLGK